MCFDECTKNINFDDLEPRLQDQALLDELSSKIGEIIKNSKDSNGSSFAELISGFNLKISIKIGDENIKPDCEPPKLFFARSASQCWCYPDANGDAYPCKC
jgi:hypothetical protein